MGNQIIQLLAILFVIGAFAWSVNAQAVDCPTGMVCIPQATFNKTLDRLEELVASKDVIAKMLTERGASEAALNSALKTIEGWKSLDEINNVIILKQKDVIALYEKVITMYQNVVEKLEQRLAKPKSAWQKFVGILKTAATLLSGIALGRGL